MMFREIITLAVVAVFLAPAHAQWVKTDGPDSVRVLSTADGGVVYAGTASGVFLSQDSGSTWAARNNGLTHTNVRSIILRPSLVFVGTEGGGVFRSTNSGTSWTQASNGLTGLDIRAFAFSGSHLFAGTNNGIFRSSDSGVSWAAFNNGLTSLDVRALVGVPIGISATMTLYAGTSGGGVFRLASGDSIWSAQNDSLTNLDVRALGNDGPFLFAGTTSGAYRWEAQHIPPRWTLLASVPSVEIRSLAGVISPGVHQNEWVLAGTSGAGVFLLRGSGSENAINEGLTDPQVHAVSSYESFGHEYLFIGTSSGVWRRQKSTLIPPGSSIKPKTEPTIRFLGGSSVLSFTLASESPVTLRAYDAQGRQAAVLWSGKLPAGSHEKALNLQGFPEGVYFLRLSTPSFTETRRMVVMP